MMSSQSYDAIYIFCPPSFTSGGPEALHQLGCELRRLGHNAFMIYANGDHSQVRIASSPENDQVLIFPEHSSPRAACYTCYDVPFASVIFDRATALIIVPEIWPGYFSLFDKAKKAYWWLACDSGVAFLSAVEGGKYLDSSLCLHLCQSEAASRLLETIGINERYKVSDYTRISDAVPKSIYRRNIVIYNNRSSVAVVPLKDANADIEFGLLAGLTADEVHLRMLEAKVYLDFGWHPGMDRMPREAAALGCCVVSNRVGAAAYFEDVPIQDQYKFNQDEYLTRCVAVIRSIFCDFASHSANFERYRRKIANEKNTFQNEVFSVFGKAF